MGLAELIRKAQDAQEPLTLVRDDGVPLALLTSLPNGNGNGYTTLDNAALDSARRVFKPAAAEGQQVSILVVDDLSSPERQKRLEEVMVRFPTGRVPGSAAGRFVVPADFNEPLEDFMEYM